MIPGWAQAEPCVNANPSFVQYMPLPTHERQLGLNVSLTDIVNSSQTDSDGGVRALEKAGIGRDGPLPIRYAENASVSPLSLVRCHKTTPPRVNPLYCTSTQYKYRSTSSTICSVPAIKWCLHRLHWYFGLLPTSSCASLAAH